MRRADYITKEAAWAIEIGEVVNLLIDEQLVTVQLSSRQICDSGKVFTTWTPVEARPTIEEPLYRLQSVV